MFILILLLQLYTLAQTAYNVDFVSSALNISQSAYCMSDLDEWSCATCAETNVYQSKIIHKSELVIVVIINNTIHYLPGSEGRQIYKTG